MSNSVNVANVSGNAARDATAATHADNANAKDSSNEFAALLQSAHAERSQSPRTTQSTADRPNPTRARSADAAASAVKAKDNRSADTKADANDARANDAGIKAADRTAQVTSQTQSQSQSQNDSSTDNPQSDDTTRSDEPISDAAAQVLLMMGLGPAPAPPPVAPAVPTTDAANAALPGIAGVATASAATSMQIGTGVTGAAPQPQPNDQTNTSAAFSSDMAEATNASTTPAASTQASDVLNSLLTGKPADASQSSTLDQLQSQLQAQLLAAHDDKRRSEDIGATRNPTDLLSALGGLNSLADTQGGKELSAMQANGSNVINAPVGSAGWAPELASKLLVLAKHDISKATLYVTPNDLGPVRIQIETSQNQASVWFTADHPDTRSAIEQSLPKLRDMFQAQGMNLNDAGVFSGSSGQQATRQSPQSWPTPTMDSQPDVADTVTVRTLSLKLVDAYA